MEKRSRKLIASNKGRRCIYLKIPTDVLLSPLKNKFWPPPLNKGVFVILCVEKGNRLKASESFGE